MSHTALHSLQQALAKRNSKPKGQRDPGEPRQPLFDPEFALEAFERPVPDVFPQEPPPFIRRPGEAVSVEEFNQAAMARHFDRPIGEPLPSRSEIGMKAAFDKPLVPIGPNVFEGTAASTPAVAPGGPTTGGFTGGAFAVAQGIGPEVRDIAAATVRGAEGVIGEFAGEGFQFPSTRNQIDEITSQAGFDPKRVRDAADRDIGDGGFRGDEPEWRKFVLETRVAQDILSQANKIARQPSGIGIGSLIGELVTLGQGLPEMEKREFIETLMMFPPASVVGGPAAGVVAGLAGRFGSTALRSKLASAGLGEGRFGFGRARDVGFGWEAAEEFATRPGVTRGLGEAPVTPATALPGEAPAAARTVAKEPWQMTRDEFRQPGGQQVETETYIRNNTGASTPQELLDYYKGKYPELNGVTIGGLRATKESGPLVNEGATRLVFNQGEFSARDSKIHLTKDADLVVVRHEIEHLLDAIHKIPIEDGRFGRYAHGKFNASDYLHRSLVRDALAEGKTVPDEVLRDYPDLANRLKHAARTLSDIPELVANLSPTRGRELGRGTYFSTDRGIAQGYAEGRAPFAGDVAARPRTGTEVLSQFSIPKQSKIFSRNNALAPGLLQELEKIPVFARVWRENWITAKATRNNLWAAAEEARILPKLQEILESQGFKGARHSQGGRGFDYAIWDQSIISQDKKGIQLFRGAPAAPRYRWDAHSVGGGAAEATQAPEVVRSLEKAWQFRRIDRQGSTGAFLDKIPGIKQIQRWLRPANTIPEPIQVAKVAEDGARADFSTAAFATRTPIIREIDTVFGPGASRGGKTSVRFTGGADDVSGLEGTVLDIAQRPHLYELTAEQKAFLARWQGRNQKLLRSVQEGYGSSLTEFQVRPGGVFLSNADVAEDLLAQLDTTATQAVMTGRAKTRVFETAADRMKVDAAFVPETDILKLQSGMDEAKAVMAGREVFKDGAGGLTLTEVIDLTHPTLRKTRDAFAKKVASLEGKIARAEAASTKAARAEKRIEKRITKMDQGRVLLMDNLEAMGDSLGGEFPRLAKQIKDLQKRSEALQSKMLHLRDVAATKGIKRNGLMPELEAAAVRLERLRIQYQGANLRGYTFVDKPLFRYYPVDDAKAVRELIKTSDNPIVRLLDNVRGTAFAGDLSPIAGIQLPLFALFHPVTAVRRLIGAGRGSVQARDLMRTFRTDTLAKAVAEDLQGYRDLAFWSGHPIAAGNPKEFSGGLLRLIPGFTKANEALFSVVLRQTKATYDEQLRRLTGSGLPDDAAKAIAADMATKAIPLWNPSRLGLSDARAAAIRAIPTSVSFLLRPAALMAEATTGFAKMALRKALTPQESLAVRLMLTYTASTEFLSITSAVISALGRGQDPWAAAERAANPMSPRFGDLIIGNRRIPLGGPFRGIIRAIVPREVGGSPVPVPFGGIGNYFRNRLNPGLDTQFRLIQNRDYHKGKIRKGHMPEQILRTLLYEIEGMAPLTAGSAISGLRRELSPGDIAEESFGQFLGTNVIKESAFQARNATVEQWAAAQDITEEGGGRITSFFQLGPRDRNRFEAANPDEVASIKAEQARQVRQGIPRAVERGHLEEATTNRIAEEEALVKELFLPKSDPKAVTVDAFRRQYSQIQAKAAADRAAVDRSFQIFEEENELPEEPNKRAMVQYYDAFDKARTESGILVFELLDEILAALETQWSPDQKQWVEENTGQADHPPVVQEYLRDRDLPDVRKWRLLNREKAEEEGVLSLYYEMQRQEDQSGFRAQNAALDYALGIAQDRKDALREEDFDLERILYKWGYIDTPKNPTLDMLVFALAQQQGGLVTNRLAIDEPVGVR